MSRGLRFEIYSLKTLKVPYLDVQFHGDSTEYGSAVHFLQDDTSLSWRKHKKHFFILSNAGKPIYSRFVNEM